MMNLLHLGASQHVYGGGGKKNMYKAEPTTNYI